MPPGSGNLPPRDVGNGRFVLEKLLGAGIFAEVWFARDRQRGDTPVAVKLEDYRDEAMQLEAEAQLLRSLAKPNVAEGFLEVLWCGEAGSHHYCLVMDLMSASLEDRLVACKGRFPVLAVVSITEQVLKRLEYLHSKGIVHRDIKPENFMCGVNAKAHHIYMIDFGLSNTYYQKDKHIPFREGLGVIGTPRYASLNALRGHEQSRRDDLEAVGYMLLQFLIGSLPWSGLEAATKSEKLSRILDTKKRTALDGLCSGLPEAFPTYLRIVRGLKFEERPPYDDLFNLFASLREDMGSHPEDHQLPWVDRRLELVPFSRQERLPQPDDNLRKNPFAFVFTWLTDSCASTNSRASLDSGFDDEHRRVGGELPVAPKF
eukprot:TRINITY_DN23284_c0_g1_i2.p1 TRINITY_DN23284_c0_g1~~TRINITY_DN23284_c0_g1_i2.p1  ORF type:complete len:373 (+),score=63.16 TRINITY_DN23284_c0_g1_i2:122-1240(+)